MIELAEIFRRYGPQYRAQFGDRMPRSHLAAMQAIEACRTETLGGHVYACDACEEVQYSYHSCQNRHCPKCQNQNAEHWLAKQRHFLLPVPYFMVTFTLPIELRVIARRQPKQIYNLLFRTSAAALQELARDPRFVGGQIGMMGVLHTWQRDLNYHPHVHYLVPGGGLAADGQTWLPVKNDFLVHVKPLAKLFRAKFRDGLKQTDLFDCVPTKTWLKKWVVHCQPVGSGYAALKYLAPYVFRVAISNNRILKLEDDQVTFRYQASDTGKTKYCTLPAVEFIRRFLQHVLPKGLMKVRYYGFLSPGNRPLLHQIWQLLTGADAPSSGDDQPTEPKAQEPIHRCRKCGQTMRLQQTLKPARYRPP